MFGRIGQVLGNFFAGLLSPILRSSGSDSATDAEVDEEEFIPSHSPDKPIPEDQLASLLQLLSSDKQKVAEEALRQLDDAKGAQAERVAEFIVSGAGSLTDHIRHELFDQFFFSQCPASKLAAELGTDSIHRIAMLAGGENEAVRDLAVRFLVQLQRPAQIRSKNRALFRQLPNLEPARQIGLLSALSIAYERHGFGDRAIPTEPYRYLLRHISELQQIVVTLLATDSLSALSITALKQALELISLTEGSLKTVDATVTQMLDYPNADVRKAATLCYLTVVAREAPIRFSTELPGYLASSESEISRHAAKLTPKATKATGGAKERAATNSLSLLEQLLSGQYIPGDFSSGDKTRELAEQVQKLRCQVPTAMATRLCAAWKEGRFFNDDFAGLMALVTPDWRNTDYLLSWLTLLLCEKARELPLAIRTPCCPWDVSLRLLETADLQVFVATLTSIKPFPVKVMVEKKREPGQSQREEMIEVEQLFDPARRCFERLQEIEVDLTFHESTFTDPRGRLSGDWRSTPLADRARALIINLSETEWGEQCLWRVMSERTGTYRRLAPLIIQAESESAKASRIVKLCDFILASDENSYCIELVCVAVGFRAWTSQKQTVVDALLKLHKGLQQRNQRQALGGIEVLVVRIAPELAGQLAPDTAPSSATDTP